MIVLFKKEDFRKSGQFVNLGVPIVEKLELLRLSAEAAEKDMNTALVMLNSGVAHEAGYHLTQALSKVTNIGQQSMSLLIEKGLL